MIRALFSAPEAAWPQYHAALERAFDEAGLKIVLSRAIARPADVDYIIYAPNDALTDFSPYTGCKAVMSLWAGVERIVANPTLTQPLCRMVDEGLRAGMVEYVTGHVLRYHLGLDRYTCATPPGWDRQVPPLARDRTVGILGLGALGSACARTLAGFGFHVVGWSQTQKTLPGITCLTGPGGLTHLLAEAEIVVLILPATPGTENLMNADRLAAMRPGAALINPGRGTLIDDDALLAALDRGHLAHATLDVFRTEPLPENHPFRAHPRVTVTPHIAAETRPDSAARVIAENIRRAETGEPMLYRVDRTRGY
ncbi:2-hydroxyacid dehydrogenase [Actibacterium sp. XHP0104]|uniref:2-hydroxyacid dehydrogenase n=1 Tax=Actibacterium sp. XHP0104 TaxID=2984335 RepID=UPI0021E94F1C|nr:glyoxylate/hydroxypyruvate reductase A [Actibacterium sp. XHP0104]MCV2880433.1 glyoxylate/hydroxypyruvate reductase A [Actibacterium sp. XHP0104]